MDDESDLDDVFYTETDRAAEEALAAQALIAPEAYDRARLPPEAFLDPKYRYVWEGVKRVRSEGGEVDALSVGDALEADGKLEAVGGLAFLGGLVATMPTADNADYWAAKVREGWLTREVLLTGSHVRGQAVAGLRGTDLLAEAQARLERLEGLQERTDPDLATEVERELDALRHDVRARDRGERVVRGLPTGGLLEGIVPGGLPLDRLVLMAGETGTYKSTTKRAILDQVAQAGYPVLDMSLEDSVELTRQSALARLSGVPLANILNRELSTEDRRKLKAVAGKATQVFRNVTVTGDVPANIDDAIALVRSYQRSRGIRLVALDYLQLMTDDRATIADSFRRLQLAAKRDRVSWLILSQPSQHKIDDREGAQKRMRLADMLYGAPGASMFIKLALAIYRPANYPRPASNRDPHYEFMQEHPDLHEKTLELWVRKNVIGESNVYRRLIVEPDTGRITPWV